MPAYKNKFQDKNGNTATVYVSEGMKEFSIQTDTTINGKWVRFGWEFDGEYIYDRNVKVAYSNISNIEFKKNMLTITGKNELNNMRLIILVCPCDEKAYKLVCEKLGMNNNINVDDIVKKGKRQNVLAIITAIILGVALIGGIIYWAENRNNSSNWNNLTNEEKEWYEDNYGDGKMEDINDAIEDYENK